MPSLAIWGLAKAPFFVTCVLRRFPNANPGVTVAAACWIPTKPISGSGGTGVVTTRCGCFMSSNLRAMRGAMPLWRAMRSASGKPKGSPAPVATTAPHYPRWSTTLPQVAEPQQRPLTARGATWLVMRRPGKRNANHEQHLTQLKAQHVELAIAIALTQDFADLVRHRWPDKLDDWLACAATSSLAPFRGFAKRLWADYDAVKAAITLLWSNGPVEGHINRLKMVKRTMFGRAKLDLLSQRVLLAT